jgi:hypothetical protein
VSRLLSSRLPPPATRLPQPQIRASLSFILLARFLGTARLLCKGRQHRRRVFFPGNPSGPGKDGRLSFFLPGQTRLTFPYSPSRSLVSYFGVVYSQARELFRVKATYATIINFLRALQVLSLRLVVWNTCFGTYASYPPSIDNSIHRKLLRDYFVFLMIKMREKGPSNFIR